MKSTFAAVIFAATLVSGTAMAQPAVAPAKPSLMARMKAAHAAKVSAKTATVKSAVSKTAEKPAKTASNNGQRTAKSLACSKEADSKNIHGKARKGFMAHCKKA